MDPRITQIIDRLLDDCLLDDIPKLDRIGKYNYPDLSQKDLLQITQNFLEFKYPKQTRQSVTDAAPGEEKVGY